MRVTRCFPLSITAIGLTAVVFSTIGSIPRSAQGAKARPAPAGAPQDGPLLAPPAVETPNGIVPLAQTPFEETAVPTWPNGQPKVVGQPQGNPDYGAAPVDGDYNQIPTIADTAIQAPPQVEAQPPAPKKSRNPLSKISLPSFMSTGKKTQSSPPQFVEVEVEPPAPRKPSRWNPFARQPKESEEAPLYQYGPDAQASAEPMPPPPAQSQRGWRWPWSAK